MSDLPAGALEDPVKVVDNGSDAQRYTIVFLGDGFDASEQGLFESQVTGFVNELQGIQPFDQPSVMGRINIYRLNVVSAESGVSITGLALYEGEDDIERDTYFSAVIGDDPHNKATVDWDTGLVEDVLDDHDIPYDAVMLILNTSRFGGTRRNDQAAYTPDPGVETIVDADGTIGVEQPEAGVHSIAFHELGHLLGLADEYPTPDGRLPLHRIWDTSSPNVAWRREVSFPWRMRWRHWMVRPSRRRGEDNTRWDDVSSRWWILSTNPNSDCAPDERALDELPGDVNEGSVGAFEGADNHSCGAYRPMFDCRMRYGLRTNDFCVVCREAIERELVARTAAPWATSGSP